MTSAKYICIYFWLVVLLGCVGSTPQHGSEDAEKRLDGNWEVIEHKTNTSKSMVGGRVQFSKGEFITTLPSKEVERARYTIDGSDEPWRIDIEAEVKGQKDLFKGIVRSDGDDRLLLCVAYPGEDRPTSFDNIDVGNTSLMVLKRRH
jgi:uncharacterized protein (TIGR03067 family)